jgi:hypothetical protein
LVVFQELQWLNKEAKTMNKAEKVLSKTPTLHGYEIRREIWPSSFGEEPLEIETCYTDAGYWIGDLRTAKFLCEKHGIAPESASPEVKPGDLRPCSIGFCEQEQKWYGWSHRAIFGFGIGSKVNKGDCAYIADTPEGLIEDRVEFFGDVKDPERIRAECQILPDRSGIRILPEPMILPVIAGVDIFDALSGDDVPTEQVDIAKGYHVIKCGRGEWIAETLGDAKQMAMDFAESVS